MGSIHNETHGLQITPLVVAITGALWLVLFGLMAWTLAETVGNGKSLERLADVKERVDDHEARIRVLEQK